eukprot:10020168-Alexandrium_andersonii.AAC.1
MQRWAHAATAEGVLRLGYIVLLTTFERPFFRGGEGAVFGTDDTTAPEGRGCTLVLRNCEDGVCRVGVAVHVEH